MRSSVVLLCPQLPAGADAQLSAREDAQLTRDETAHARWRAEAGGQLAPPGGAADGEMHAVAVGEEEGG